MSYEMSVCGVSVYFRGAEGLATLFYEERHNSFTCVICESNLNISVMVYKLESSISTINNFFNFR